ncbi:MAG TPA: hypothetical protein VM912_13770 [Terriglobales bacterium]|nr:hypothetical protein [Terriglobales bacterium]
MTSRVQYISGLNSHVTDASHNDLRRITAFERQHAYGIELVVRTEHEMVAIALYVLNCATLALAHSVDVGLIAALQYEQVVMAIDKQSRSGQQPRIHPGRFLRVHLDQNEALPWFPAFGGRPQPPQK